MKRKKIYNEMEALMDHYCEGCFLYKQNRKEKGRNYAHRFCISFCTVGESIKNLGNKLTK